MVQEVNGTFEPIYSCAYGDMRGDNRCAREPGAENICEKQEFDYYTQRMKEEEEERVRLDEFAW